ncbi:hypothetical protein KYK29_03450 [Shinella daejeonensis]|uniref:hypothetical protein n=1 Tax=Shinella daejeonensis TaxID=659017 RepID=UPI0020C7AA41|nr:hypothetical protein [Shinella daejeonensis]MCP8893971.1 hypothetical protein [Shinella daejeonensis]
MQSKSGNSKDPVVERLRPLVYLYAAVNLAVAALLVTTVSATPPAQEVSRISALR